MNNELDWYLLIHQVPARPLYLRAQVRNRLAAAGAVALKKSVYALPRSDASRGPLEAIAEEIRAGGGEAHLCEARFTDPRSEAALVASFRAERDAEYGRLAAEARAWITKLERRSGSVPPDAKARSALTRLQTRMARTNGLDLRGATSRSGAEAALATLAARLLPAPPDARRARAPHAELVGRTWVTRRGIQVDRIASAWFVRRFVDEDASFRFIDPHAEEPRQGELRFDIQGGDFSHEDDRCTMETLVLRSGVRDAALTRVAQIVHDIDIKDGKFARPEARGVERLLHGIVAGQPDDEARLERGFALFDDLYASFARRRSD